MSCSRVNEHSAALHSETPLQSDECNSEFLSLAVLRKKSEFN